MYWREGARVDLALRGCAPLPPLYHSPRTPTTPPSSSPIDSRPPRLCKAEETLADPTGEEIRRRGGGASSMPRHDMSLPDAFKLVLGKDQDKWPPEATLLVAAHYGDIRRLKEIAKSIDVEGKGLQETLANANFIGMYALHAVCDSGDMYALQYLVEDLNMDVNKPDTMRGFTPAMHAVLYGNLPTLRFLFDHGASLHGQHKGLSLLHAAAEGGMI